MLEKELLKYLSIPRILYNILCQILLQYKNNFLTENDIAPTDYSRKSNIVDKPYPDERNKQTNDQNEATTINDGLEGAKGFYKLNLPVYHVTFNYLV